jgi:predicted fused transcriptional regulator/phosphomethylpyrimidine kinase
LTAKEARKIAAAADRRRLQKEKKERPRAIRGSLQRCLEIICNAANQGRHTAEIANVEYSAEVEEALKRLGYQCFVADHNLQIRWFND